MFEWGCIGFMLGTLVCMIFFGAGVVIGDKRTHDGDSDDIVYHFSPDRECGGMDRHDPTPEEIETVLYVMRLGASDKERWILDYLIDKEGSNGVDK